MTQPDGADTLAQLRQRIADSVQPLLMDTLPKPIAAMRAEEVADAVLAVVQPEMAELADYRNRITWETNCGEHARLLDSCYAETVRAEQAEAEVKRLSDLADRLGQTERQQRDTLARVRGYIASQTAAMPDGYPVAVPAEDVLTALNAPSPPAP